MAARHFRGAINSDWNTNGNWLEGFVPTPADDAIFDVASPACTLSANADCLTLDCTGFLSTITPGAWTMTVFGLVFTLVPGCWVVGTELVDFVSVAGPPVLITSAGNTLYNVRLGNVGPGGVYQQVGALAIANDLDCVNGSFFAADLNVGRDIIFEVAMLAGGFGCALLSTVVVGRNLSWLANALVLIASTSTWNFTGTGGVAMGLPGLNVDFYNLTIAAPGQVFTYTNGAAGDRINVYNILLTGTGTANMAGPGWGIYVRSALVNGFQPNAACALNIPITLDPQTGAGTTVTIPACTIGANLTLIRDPALLAVAFQLTGAVNVTGTFAAYGTFPGTPTLDLNGFNLVVTGPIDFGNGVNGMGLVTIGAATLSCTGALTHLGNPLVDARIFDIAGGSLLVGGNFTHTGAVAAIGQRINMTNNSLVRVGASWNTTPVLVFNPVPVGDTSAVEFTAAGPFAIACNVSEVWPVVRIAGGGAVALPNPFFCTDLIITAGTVTAGAVLTILRAFNNGGTFTGGAGMYVGTSFVNTGVLVMGGVNLHLTGPVCSVSGFNPTTLTMESTLLRLQFLASCNITVAFIIADRLVPGVIQFLAAGAFVFAVVNSQVVSTDGTVQLVSSVAGTRYNLTATVLTSKQNLWPRDCNYAGGAFVADLTNRDLGNNVGMTLNFPPAFVRVITEDAGQDLLAAGGIGPINYCWLVGTSLVNITALAAAFAAGGNNWHRKTNIPWAFLGNLVKGGNYWIALGLADDRGVRVTPNIAAGDFVTVTAISDESGGGGGHKIHVNVKVPTMS